ncbi:MAG TPA: CHAD domain-containing protein [Candidatus Kryptonia bacterium]
MKKPPRLEANIGSDLMSRAGNYKGSNRQQLSGDPVARNQNMETIDQSAGIHFALVTTLDERLRSFMERVEKCGRKPTEKAIHDLRVATRRLLALLDLLGSVIPNGKRAKVRKQLKSLLDTLSALRDLQVQIILVRGLIEKHPTLTGYLGKLISTEAAIGRRAVKAIARFDTAEIETHLVQTRVNLGKLLDEPLMEGVFMTILRGLLAELFFKVMNLHNEIVSGSAGDISKIHDLRVAFKNFRYTAEIMQPLVPAISKKQLKSMGEFQAKMGEIQDLDVLISGVSGYAKHARKKSGRTAGVLADPFNDVVADLTNRQNDRVKLFLESRIGIKDYLRYFNS